MYPQSCSYLPNKKRSSFAGSLPQNIGLLRTLSTKSFQGFDDSSQMNFPTVKCSNQNQFSSRTTNIMDFVYSCGSSSRINLGNSVSDFPIESGRPKHNCKELITQFQSVTAPSLCFTSFLVGGFVGSKSQLGRQPTKGLGVKMWDKISQFLDSLGNASSHISAKDKTFKFSSEKKCTIATKPIKKETLHTNIKKNVDSCQIQEETRPKQSYAEVAKSMATKSTPVQKNPPGGGNNESNRLTCLKDNRLPKLVIDPLTSCSKQTCSVDRNRFTSECSADSEDSFIVFEYCEGDTNSFVDDDSESSDDESVLSSAENEECLSSTCGSAPSENFKFNNNKEEKKVRFAEGKELAKVHQMVAWDFAYRLARRGPWEMLARDSARFKARIRNTEALLAPVLDPLHRANVYLQRFI